MKETRLIRRFFNSILFSVMLYSVFGLLWIAFSDYLLLAIVNNNDLYMKLQTLKGFFYILLTSLLLYRFIYRHKVMAEKKERAQSSIVMNVSLPMVVIENSGDITLVNKAFTETYGYTWNDIPDTGTWFKKVYPDEEYRNMVIKRWEEEIDSNRATEQSHVYIIRDLWGARRTVEFIVLKKQNSSNVICKDISRQKVLEEERIQENKMRALGELAGGIAHDFNNQLSGIIGFSDLMSRSVDKDSELREYLDSIISSAETAARLTTELLAYTRNKTGKETIVDMLKVIDEVSLIVNRTFPMQYKLKVSHEDSAYGIKGNRARLKSLVLNLIINARDAMAEGGDITLSLFTQDRPMEQINGLPLLEGKYLILEVGDQGSGISPIHLGRIFEPLYTTKNKGHGTGMGLAMVYSTLRSHRGSVEVKSTLGKGSVFRIYLPLLAENPGRQDQRMPLVSKGNSPIM